MQIQCTPTEKKIRNNVMRWEESQNQNKKLDEIERLPEQKKMRGEGVEEELRESFSI